MSGVYNTAPPTAGQVTMHTSHGDVTLALWSKESPKATRNFVQHCLDGYYDGCIFHRVIQDFMIQSGDPTGTGRGGESIYPEGCFRDEFHSRLRFIHRGILAMANGGSPHSNGSQFFITLSECPWLQKKHTIFGKVVGDSIYNVVEMGKVETAGEAGDEEAGDRPLEPPVITSVDVDWNPFDDMVRRERKRLHEGEGSATAAAATKRKKKAKKNLGLLSFGEDEDHANAEKEDEERGGFRSSHDVLHNDARLSSKAALNAASLAADVRDAQEKERTPAGAKGVDGGYHEGGISAASAGDADGHGRGDNDDDDDAFDDDFDKRMRDSVMEKRSAASRPPTTHAVDEAGAGSSERVDAPRERKKARRTKQADVGALKLASRNRNQTVNQSAVVGDQSLTSAEQHNRDTIRLRRRSTQDREKSTLSKLQSFKSSLAARGSTTTTTTTTTTARDMPSKAGLEEDGGVRDRVKRQQDDLLPAAWRVDAYIDDEDGDDGIGDWKRHTLMFSEGKKKRGVDAMARRDDVDDYVVFDPLLEKAKGKFGSGAKQQQDQRRRRREWS